MLPIKYASPTRESTSQMPPLMITYTLSERKLKRAQHELRDLPSGNYRKKTHTIATTINRSVQVYLKNEVNMRHPQYNSWFPDSIKSNLQRNDNHKQDQSKLEIYSKARPKMLCLKQHLIHNPADAH